MPHSKHLLPYSLRENAATRSETASALAVRVRQVLADWSAEHPFQPVVNGWLTGFSAELSERLGEAGLIGAGIPRKYGGGGGTSIDRLAITEELLAAGAPVAAHWFAERQVAPALVRYGTDKQRGFFIPRIVAGKCFFSIGMSEPEAGSDLAAIATRAERTQDGWSITGTKIWTSHAQLSHYLLVLCRSKPLNGNPRNGLTQFIVPLDAPGVRVKPIDTMEGSSHLTEVHLDGVKVSTEDIVGVEGQGWSQVMEELVYERTGAERLLSVFPLLVEAHRAMSGWDQAGPAEVLGRLLTDAFALRETVASVVSTMADSVASAAAAAALSKDVATRYEQGLVEELRLVIAELAPRCSISKLEELSRAAALSAPTITLRGGANEVLRAIVAKDLLGRSSGTLRDREP